MKRIAMFDGRKVILDTMEGKRILTTYNTIPSFMDRGNYESITLYRSEEGVYFIHADVIGNEPIMQPIFKSQAKDFIHEVTGYRPGSMENEAILAVGYDQWMVPTYDETYW